MDYPASPGGRFYFRATGFPAEPSGVWTSDGTAAGTVLVKSMNCFGLVNVGGTLFFGGSTGPDDGGLWKSDGTPEGTVFVKGVSPSGIVDVGGMAFFVGSTQQSGNEVSRSDGTAAGTFMAKDINPGRFSGAPFPRGILNVNGVAYFFEASDGVHGHELWRSDGTETGTELVGDFIPGLRDGMVGGLDGVVAGRLHGYFE